MDACQINCPQKKTRGGRSFRGHILHLHFLFSFRPHLILIQKGGHMHIHFPMGLENVFSLSFFFVIKVKPTRECGLYKASICYLEIMC